MGKMILQKIDLAKVPGVTIIENTKGRIFADITDGLYHGKNGAHYLDVVVYENDKTDNYGNDYAIKPSQSKESREAGEKMPFIGNGKNLGKSNQQRSTAVKTPDQWDQNVSEKDDIPF